MWVVMSSGFVRDEQGYYGEVIGVGQDFRSSKYDLLL